MLFLLASKPDADARRAFLFGTNLLDSHGGIFYTLVSVNFEDLSAVLTNFEMTEKLKVFLSSSMIEFAPQRTQIKAALAEYDIDTWLFEEDAGARPESIEKAFRDEVLEADIYIGLFWKKYGEFTIDEYRHAIKHRKPCLVFQKQVDVEDRDPRLSDFLSHINNVKRGVSPKWYSSDEELIPFVRDAVLSYQTRMILKVQASRGKAYLCKAPSGVIRKSSKLIGRDALITEALKYIEDQKHVLLTGFAGTGKTVLAAEIASLAIEAGKGSVIWVDAGYDSVDGIFESIAHLLMSKDELDRLLKDARVSYIKKLLSTSGIGLLVLDDVRNRKIISSLRSAIPENISLLVTSRHNIGNIDETILVSELYPEAAIEMLSHYAESLEITADEYRDDAETAVLCKELGYHALGIFISATLLAKNLKKPKYLNLRIQQGKLSPVSIELEEEHLPEDRPSYSVLIVLEEMYVELSSDAKSAFDAFALLNIPKASLCLVSECVEDMDILDAEDALAELTSWNLVTEEVVDFYRMHDLVHSFAFEMKYGAGVTKDEKLVEVVINFVEKFAQDFDQLGLDMSNIIDAANIALPDNRLSIVENLTLDGYLDNRGHTLGYIELLDDVIRSIQENDLVDISISDQDEILILLLGKRGNIFFERNDLENARLTYQQVLDLSGDDNHRAKVMAVIGKVLSLQGEYKDADEYFADGDSLAEKSGDFGTYAFVREQWSMAAGHRGDDLKVRDLSKPVVQHNDRLADPIRLAFAILNLASSEHHLGNFEDALENHLEGLKLVKELGHFGLIADFEDAVGRDYHELGKPEEAKKYFQRAIELCDQIGDENHRLDIEKFLRDHKYPLPLIE